MRVKYKTAHCIHWYPSILNMQFINAMHLVHLIMQVMTSPGALQRLLKHNQNKQTVQKMPCKNETLLPQGVISQKRQYKCKILCCFHCCNVLNAWRVHSCNCRLYFIFCHFCKMQITRREICNSLFFSHYLQI